MDVKTLARSRLVLLLEQLQADRGLSLKAAAESIRLDQSYANKLTKGQARSPGLEVRVSDVRDAVLCNGTIYVSRRARVSRLHLLVAHEIGHWALARASFADREIDADYLAGALLVPRVSLERELRAGWDLEALRRVHVHAPASTIATRIAQVRRATAAIYDEGRLRRRVGPELDIERELVDQALVEERPVRHDATTGAWPVIDGRWRRVIVVGRGHLSEQGERTHAM